MAILELLDNGPYSMLLNISATTLNFGELVVPAMAKQTTVSRDQWKVSAAAIHSCVTLKMEVTIKVKQESYIAPIIQDKATIITGAHTKSLSVSGS